MGKDERFDQIVKNAAMIHVYEDVDSEEPISVGYTKGGVTFGTTTDEIKYEVDNYGAVDVETTVEDAYISFDAASFTLENLRFFVGGDAEVTENDDGSRSIRRKVGGEADTFGKVVARVSVKGGRKLEFILYGAKALSDGEVVTEDKGVGTIGLRFVATHDGESDYLPFEYRLIEETGATRYLSEDQAREVMEG